MVMLNNVCNKLTHGGGFYLTNHTNKHGRKLGFFSLGFFRVFCCSTKEVV